MRLLYGSDADVARWVARHIPHMGGGDFGPCSAIGVFDDNAAPVAGVVYTDYMPQYGNIQISVAAVKPNWLTRNLATYLLGFPFTQLGVQRVTAITPPDEETSVWRFLSRFGFQVEGRIRKGLGTEDAVVWGLLAEEWAKHPYNLAARKPPPKRKRRRRRGTMRMGLEGVTIQ